MTSNDNILRTPRRVATPSIRGYYFQFLHTVLHWIHLKGNEVLWCEGNEDIDIQLADGTRIEEQIKHLASVVTQRSKAFKTTLTEFIKGFVYHRSEGRKVRFVFRTSASFEESKSENLELWLSGEPTNIIGIMQELSRLIGAEGSAALADLKKNSWEKEFIDSVSWLFDECDYEALKEGITQELSKDPRCEGISPAILTDRVIHRVILASCARNISDRRLTMLDFELLVNDALVERLCERTATSLASRDTLYLGLAAKEKEVCSIVIRFQDHDMVMKQLASIVHKMVTHPDYQEISIDSMWDLPQMRDELRRLDFDLFGAMAVIGGDTPSLRDWFPVISFSTYLAKVRSMSDVLICDSATQAICDKLHLPEFDLKIVDSADLPSRFANRFATWILQRDKMADVFGRKIRCIADISNKIYFTQENPFRVNLLAPQIG